VGFVFSPVSYNIHNSSRNKDTNKIYFFNTLNTLLNPIYHLLVLLGAHPILHISGVRVKYLFYKIYEIKSVSKLQIQFATYVFKLSAGNGHR
jgi:hypothetical protein